MPRHITVVYTIHDEAAAKDELEQLGQRYQAYDPENPPAIGISAMSNSNEMLRLEQIDKVVGSKYGDEADDEIESILSRVSC